MSFLFGFPFDFDGTGGSGRRNGRGGDDDVHIDGVSADGDEPRGDHAAPRNPNAFKVPRITRAGSGKGGVPSKAGKVGGIVIAVIVALAVILFASTRFVTDLMWFSQLGFASVIVTQWGMQVGMWIVCAVLFALVALLASALAIHARPADADGMQLRMRGGTLELSQGVSSKVARRIALVVSLVVGIFFGASLSANWTELLLMFHAQSFGRPDPQFGLDAGFYVFVLPGLNAILATVLTMLVVALVMSALTHLIMGGVRMRVPSAGGAPLDMTRRARRQLGVWIILVAILGAARVALGAFNALTEQGDRVTGATYTSVHATIPAVFIAAALVLVIGVFLGVWLIASRRLTDSFAASGATAKAGAAARVWRTPAVAVAVGVVIALVASVVYPTLIQRFKVNPNAQELESTYIARNIEATSYAYGLDGLKVEPYNATTKGESGALASEADTTAQIRLLDPQVVSPTFKQLQQSKQYYTFADTLAVDKYEVDGVSQDTVIAARELDLAGNDNRNWVNDHTVYTHGYGVVAAYGNKVTADGQPRFFESGIPTQGKLTDTQHYEPRIYFSPNAPEYSIVGAPEGTASWEFDYPTGSEGKTTTFTGNGGPSVGNVFTRLLYAIRFGSDQILFSDRVTANSQILYDRSPKERVAKVAPYLTLDGRVYPAVVDGRVKWIVDGYTTSDAYPYAQMTDLGSASQDSTTVTSHTVSGLASKQANYIRNSVKATVDAYDGSVQLYAWDADDPVLKAWQAIFPGQYHPLSDISGDLMSHLRYPESLFKVQRELLAKYHVASASQFFSGEDFWQTPVDPTEPQSQQANDILQPPYYLTLQTGGTKEPVFSLTSTYIPAGNSTREILTGFLSVDSDAGSKAGEIGPNYGTLRLQELPKDSNVPGPGQAQNNFNANADVSKELNLLESGSTNVVRGNLLTLPLGGGLVYVQPVYVKSSGATSFPLLKKVLVAFGDQVGFADTLDEALNQVFGGDSGASAGDAENAGGSSSSGTQSQSQQSGGSQSGQPSGSQSSQSQSPELKAALDDAAKAMKDSQTAMKNGDWSAYGEAQKRLETALNKALELEGQ